MKNWMNFNKLYANNFAISTVYYIMDDSIYKKIDNCLSSINSLVENGSENDKTFLEGLQHKELLQKKIEIFQKEKIEKKNLEKIKFLQKTIIVMVHY